jgi:hypothetical protein
MIRRDLSFFFVDFDELTHSLISIPTFSPTLELVCTTTVVILSQDSGHVIRIVLVCSLNGNCRSTKVRYGVYILKPVRSTS